LSCSVRCDDVSRESILNQTPHISSAKPAIISQTGKLKIPKTLPLAKSNGRLTEKSGGIGDGETKTFVHIGYAPVFSRFPARLPSRTSR
jgi:hypothetical protein